MLQRTFSKYYGAMSSSMCYVEQMDHITVDIINCHKIAVLKATKEEAAQWGKITLDGDKIPESLKARALSMDYEHVFAVFEDREDVSIPIGRVTEGSSEHVCKFDYTSAGWVLSISDESKQKVLGRSLYGRCFQV
jgi:hypothetical protein